MLKSINQTITFFIELAMLAAFAYFGYEKGGTTLMKYVLAVVIPGAAIWLWAYWAAPRSANRMRMPFLASFRLLMFLTAAFLLYECHQHKLAIILTICGVVTQLISYFTEWS